MIKKRVGHWYTVTRMFLEWGTLVLDGTHEWFNNHTRVQGPKAAPTLQSTRETGVGRTDRRKSTTNRST